MGYFDDITFINADIFAQCYDRFDLHLPGLYSLELKLEGRLALARDGGLQTVVEHPVVFWHHHQHRYQYGPPRPGDWWHHHWVLFAGERGRRLIEEGFAPLSDLDWLPTSGGAPLSALFREMVAAVRTRDPQRHGDAVILLERILILVQEEAAHQAANDGTAGLAVRAVVEAVRAEPFRDWDWAREAASLRVSLAHFRRCFGRIAGCPPHACLLRARMHEAGRRLRRGHGSVGEIAAECGYSPPEFSRRFKMVMGITPNGYRALKPHHGLDG